MDEEPNRPTTTGLRIGRVMGVPVIISPSWLVLAVLVTVIYSDVVRNALPDLPVSLIYLVSFGFVVTLCGSVFLHELGHALVSRHYKIPVRSITLEMLGGHTEMGAEAERPGIEAGIALAGPAVSLVLGGIGVAVLVLVQPYTLGWQFAFQVAACNIIVAAYNVLPGLPLDGGRALRALVWAVKGDKHLASKVAGWAGRVVAVVTAAAGAVLFAASIVTPIGVIFALLIAGVLWLGASRAIQIGTLGARFHLLDVDRLTRPAATVPTGTPLAEALRRMKDEQAWGVIVVDSADRPVALMHSAAVQAVPEDRRPWVAVDDVSRGLDDGNTWQRSWHGEMVVAAMRRHPSNEYAVVSAGDAPGVVRAADIADVLDPRKPASDDSTTR
ncbi:MAG TPA: site-2 protease family protein [Stackebrandtia sp.]|uniref:site-2 protease family protein n=1 Tax=Stackebrandtia sp. TaxID=2023065 RepID=UPI002D27BB1C|nr:site-2 protease family protein [Stackebrandtia sp.]HZE38289.1 site-2 protease family protein [Stackebrandtia sp.]